MSIVHKAKTRVHGKRTLDPLAPPRCGATEALEGRPALAVHTPGGKELRGQLDMWRLSTKVQELERKIAVLESLVDPEDVKAAYELTRITLPTARLLKLSEIDGQPAGLEDEPDEW
jgi:hypothetical protein